MPRLRNARSSAFDDAASSAGTQPVERLDDGYVGAERAPGRCELDADDAAAEHNGACRDSVELQRLPAPDHPVAVKVEPGQCAGV